MFGLDTKEMSEGMKGGNFSAPKVDSPLDNSSLNNAAVAAPEKTPDPATTVATEEPKVTEPVKEPEVKEPIPNEPVQTEPAKDEVKTPETKAPETNTVEDTKAPEPVKTFEQELSERTGGNFKTVEEMKTAMEALKAAQGDKFHDDDMKRLNELKRSGVKFDKQFWDMQGVDFESMNDPEAIIIEHMKNLDGYGDYTDKQLLLEIKDKYKKSEWLALESVLQGLYQHNLPNLFAVFLEQLFAALQQ